MKRLLMEECIDANMGETRKTDESNQKLGIDHQEDLYMYIR